MGSSVNVSLLIAPGPYLMHDLVMAEFHPLITEWFAETYGRPTAVQEAAWPLICRGEHVLALAPTGSGKTLTAFLAALSRFVSNPAEYPADRLSVLYVSPLKALNEDIRRNLVEPLAAIRSRFLAAGLDFPNIRVETRSGDTPQAERRRFLQKPPAILALTPESLAILLHNPRGRQVLSSVKYVIMDEIHAVLGNKRGSFLACQIGRLALAAGEFQRISLSATVRSPEIAAAFVGDPGRPVRIVAPPAEKEIDFRVEFPEAEGEAPPDEGKKPKGDRYGSRYTVLVQYILDRIAAGGQSPNTVLVFTDSRRRAERISFLLNEKAGKTLAFTHHGSLSRELRREVERALAAGQLPCVVATASLELGIDIGTVDEVILAGPPQAAAQTLQRIGRSGHRVGAASRGRLLPFTGIDLLLSAALSGAVADREIEEIRPIENPLDLLAQIILALCAERSRNEGELFDTIRAFFPFRTLSREAYDGVVRMLAGRFEDTRLRELKPRLYWDAGTGELTAPEGTLTLLYASGGVITNRGYYSLRLADGAKIGELDEEFVWERRLGDHFDFGSRPWQITAIGTEAVEVVPLEKSAGFTPFWKAEAAFRSPVLVRRLLEFFDTWEKTSTGAGSSALPNLGAFSQPAIQALKEFIAAQKRVQGRVPLPGTASLPVEIIDDPSGRGDSWPVALHTFRGTAVNYPLAMAMAQDLENSLGTRVEVLPDDNAILLRLPRLLGEEPETLIRQSLRRLGEAEKGWEKPFRERFESSGIFGAMFREAAERSLLLPKTVFGKRSPLWIMRERSKRLFDAVRGERNFPITAEAWRNCLSDMFDLEGLRLFVEAIREETIIPGFFRTAGPSPFARDLFWKETNVLVYEYDGRKDLEHRTGPADTGGKGRETSLTDRVIAEALDKASARPTLSNTLSAGFSARLRRELPGWAPEDALSLSEWVKERIAIPLDEWETLIPVLPTDLQESLLQDPSLGGRIGPLSRPGTGLPLMVHREWREPWLEDPLALLGPWLRYEGPLPLSRIAAVFGAGPEETRTALEGLAEAGELVLDLTVEGEDNLLCDRENLDFILRLARRKNRPLVKERPIALLTPYLALRQGLIPLERGRELPWEGLAGFSAPVKLWETDIFPARDRAYNGEKLDRAIREGRLLWYGTGRERASFTAPAEWEPLCSGGINGGEETGRENYIEENVLFTALSSGYFDIPRDFWTLKEAAGLDAPSCAKALWEAVWEGRLSADSWEPVRLGIDRGFSIPNPADLAPEQGGYRGRRIPRAIRDRWRAGPPVRGSWFSLDAGEQGPEDYGPLEEETLNRDRVRLLLARWGVLCRPLLEREAPALSWSRLLPAIRRLELAGELVTGRFFAGINSLQFAAPGIAAELEAAETVRDVYWMNALDPASPAGLNAEGLEKELPPRLGTNRLCFRGSRLAALSRRNGGELLVFIPPEDPGIGEVLDFVKIPRLRPVHREQKVSVETVNGEPAAGSPYAGTLKALGFVPDRGKLILW